MFLKFSKLRYYDQSLEKIKHIFFVKNTKSLSAGFPGGYFNVQNTKVFVEFLSHVFYVFWLLGIHTSGACGILEHVMILLHFS